MWKKNEYDSSHYDDKALYNIIGIYLKKKTQYLKTYLAVSLLETIVLSSLRKIIIQNQLYV